MIEDRRFTEADLPAVRAYFGGLVTECEWRHDRQAIRIVYRYRTEGGITVDTPVLLYRWRGVFGALEVYERATADVRTPPPMLPARLAHAVSGFLHWLVVGLARLNTEECNPFMTRASRAGEAWDVSADFLLERRPRVSEDLP